MKLIIAAALLLPITAAAPPSQPATPEPAPAPLQPLERAQMPNLLNDGGPNCPSIAKQVADASKSPRQRMRESRTLDREPQAHLLLAVDRHVEGCREVTFLRRNVAPEAGMPNVGQTRD